MSIVVNGSGTITGISTGGLPDGSVDVDTLAANSVTAAKIVDGTIVDAEVTSLAASKLTGALPAISGANLTGVVKDTTTIENNIALLGFYRASDNSKAKYSLVDQVIDEYTDATGIDAGNSTNESLTSGVYKGLTTSTTSVAFSYTGSEQSYTIPAGITSVILKAWGASGGSGSNGSNGGGGGFATGTLAVTPAQVLKIVVGGGGVTNGNGASAGPYGGGGDVMYTTTGTAAQGGGYAGFFLTSVSHGNAKLIAGGGGGGGYAPSGQGGPGGGNTGAAATGGGNKDGSGGTQSAGGTGASSNGEDGSALQGGGDGDGNNYNCGSGGGGYYGGGSGATGASDGGGGGGSGYIGGVTSGTNTAGTTYTSGGASDSNYPGSNIGTADTASNINGRNGAAHLSYDTEVAGGDLTLQSVATTAESAPTTGDIVMLIEDASGTATINTDVKAYISRDGSAFSSAVTLVDEGDWGTNKRILAAHDVDISGITSGTSMKYKITTHNQSSGSKETKIHATSLAWA